MLAVLDYKNDNGEGKYEGATWFIYACLCVCMYIEYVCVCAYAWVLCVCVYVYVFEHWVCIFMSVYTTCKHSFASLICFVYTLFLPFLCFSDFGVQLVKEQTFLVTALSVFLHCKYCK